MTGKPSQSHHEHRGPRCSYYLGLFLLLMIPALVACDGASSEVQKIALPMGYVANVQFSPFYMAKERGYFKDAGFDVTFDYRWETDGIQLVAAGEIPFTVASGDQVIQARSQGLPVVAVASWYQFFPVAIVSLADLDISSPQQLRGLSIGIPETFGASYIGLRAVLDIGGLTEQDIDLQAIGYTQLAALTSESVDAVVVYSNNAPAILEEQGIAYNILRVSDYVDLVSVGLVSSNRVIAEQPEAVERFVGAFLQGVEDAGRDLDATFALCLDYVEGLEDNRDTQRAVLEASAQLWATNRPGHMTVESWEKAQGVMLEAGLINSTVPTPELFTNNFIPAGQ